MSIPENSAINTVGNDRVASLPHRQVVTGWSHALHVESCERQTSKWALVEPSPGERLCEHCCCCLGAQLRPTLVTPWTVPARLLCPWDSPGKHAGAAAMPSCRGSPQPRDRTRVSCTAGRFFTAESLEIKLKDPLLSMSSQSTK